MPPLVVVLRRRMLSPPRLLRRWLRLWRIMRILSPLIVRLILLLLSRMMMLPLRR